jgi:hypothetical protein
MLFQAATGPLMGIVETELVAQTDKGYGPATVRCLVPEIEARVEPFENARGNSLRAGQVGKPMRDARLESPIADQPLGVMWYQIKVAAWWGLAVAIVLLGLSSYLTFSHVDVLEMYQKMGYLEAQIDLIRKQGLMSNQFILWFSTAWLPVLLGYMLWVKRLFRPVQNA